MKINRKINTFVAAAVMVAAPGLAQAYECNYGKEELTMSCAPGTTFDATTNSCVTISTS
ncbi:chitin-binding domain-containing protein [Jannaschia marina]|uniref:chitin-binding domain-containing protein n=1 Tax=Jannaschia marina TaxID=2741674 RepID=UPI0015C6CB2F|nr:chitin-binding domain-containing protein [Jannaschia marina]